MEEAGNLITEIDKIFPYTDKKIEYFKKECERLKKDEITFDEYIQELYFKFYEVINEMILYVDGNKKCSIIQTAYFKKYLPEITEYFFDDFINNPYILKKTGYWDFIVSINAKPKGKESLYITPKDFTKEYVQSLIAPLLATENRQKHYTEEIWFKVALKFADGTIYNHFETTTNRSEITRLSFEGNLTSFQPYVNQTLEDINEQKNIYKRKKAKQELQIVYNHCKDNDILIHPIFEEKYHIIQGK